MADLDVLIIDGPGSRHAEQVQAALAAREAACVRVNCSDLAQWTVEIGPGVFRLSNAAETWEATPATTVWYRRLGTPDVSAFGSEEAQLARDEMPHVLLGGLAGCGARWVDEPSQVARAEQKLYQLATAARLGVAIPQPIVTDDIALATGFLDQRRTVAKPLSPGQGIAPFVDELTVDDLSNVGSLPVLLQELVDDARADLRVVVVGGRAWTWRRPRAAGVVDWRRDDPQGDGFERVGRSEVEGDAVDLTRALGLSMSVQDWLETPDRHLFLEANPQGGWIFLDGANEAVGEALALHLDPRTEAVPTKGTYPKPFKLILWDLGRASKAPDNDGVQAPQFETPSWLAMAARSPEAVAVARRANDEAKQGAKTAEDKASRLVRLALTTVAVAITITAFQVGLIASWSLWWLPLAVPMALAIGCLSTAAFQAAQIDRVGMYRHAHLSDLATTGPRDPTINLIDQEERGRRLASWGSQHKHTALMQARAWFTKGLVSLIGAALIAAVTWGIDTTQPQAQADGNEQADETTPTKTRQS